MKIFYKFILALSCGLLAACASNTPETIVVNPSLAPIKASTIGQNKQVIVSVVNNSGNVIGTRTNNMGKSADIYVDDSLRNTIAQTVSNGLKQYGFKSVAADANAYAPTLTIYLVSLSFNSQSKVLYSNAQVTANFQVTAYNHGKEYSYSYQGSEDSMGILGSGSDAKYVDEAVSDGLNNILKDPNLIQFLAQ